MEIRIDSDRLEGMVAMIVERWSGEPLNGARRQVLHAFMEAEVKPLDRQELLHRMATPDDILEWFLAFSRTRIPGRFCEPLPESKETFACYAA